MPSLFWVYAPAVLTCYKLSADVGLTEVGRLINTDERLWQFVVSDSVEHGIESMRFPGPLAGCRAVQAWFDAQGGKEEDYVQTG